MISDPSTFTYELLNSLKFKELQKLTVQFRVSKRWAKKHELIYNLLAIKKQYNLSPGDQKETAELNDKDWQDGSLVFQDTKLPRNPEKSNDRRLTFIVENANKSFLVDSRLTFDVPPNEITDVHKNDLPLYSRDTYEIAPKQIPLNLEPVNDSRATYEIPPNKKLLVEAIDERSPEVSQNSKIFRNNVKNVMEKNRKINKLKVNELKTADGKINNFGPIKKFGTILTEKGVRNESDMNKQLQVKMLTIPYSTIGKRDKEKLASVSHVSPIKISKKSVNIKKSKIQSHLNSFKSTEMAAKKMTQQNGLSLIKQQNKNFLPSKIPTILVSKERTFPKAEANQLNDKENSKRIVCRKKSRTVDEVLVKNNISEVNFMSPPTSLNKNDQVLQPTGKSSIRNEMKGRNAAKLLQTSITNVSSKPMTATKMPDFSKIHKRQFEQMDSLHDYIKKKEERARKLFTTPQHKNQQKSESSVMKSEIKHGKSNENHRSAKAIQKEVIKNKLPPTKLQMDLKTKNRALINGVRTNKRFELQMKLRKM